MALSFIDLYCERTAPGFWNEPLNALSNSAFLIAAALALNIALRRPQRDPFEIGVIVLGGSIGIGSFVFHTLPSSGTELADVIPIWSFVAAFVLLAIFRSTGQNGPKTIRIALIAVAVTGAVLVFTAQDITTDTTTSPDYFNGSLQYAAALIALLAFAIITQWQRHPARAYVLAAAVSFLVSLLFRTIDLSTCATTGFGTHFLWHLLNGLMIGLLLQALVRALPPIPHHGKAEPKQTAITDQGGKPE